MRSVMGSALMALLVASEARAADPRPQGSGFVLRGAAGVGVGRYSIASFADDSSWTRTGFAGGAVVGFAGRRFEFDLETAVQPFRVDTPVVSQSFEAVYFLPSVRIHGDHRYLRLGIGGVHDSFSWGSSFGNENLLALSAAIGYEFSKPHGFPFAIEAYIRDGSDFDSASGTAVGVQLVGSWYQHK